MTGVHRITGFPGGSMRKNPPANAGDAGLIPVLGRSPGEGNDNPLQYSCLENPHGQRSLEGYSLWGRKESDTTKRPSTAQHRFWETFGCHLFHYKRDFHRWSFLLEYTEKRLCPGYAWAVEFWGLEK